MRGPRAAALLCAVVLGLGGTTAAYAATTGSGPAFGLAPFEFVGAAGDCGTGEPAGVDTVTAEWRNTGNPAPSVFLEKTGDIANCAAAGIDILTPLEGGPVSALTELNFQYKTVEHCGGGAPRFNIVSGDRVAFLGCNAGTATDAGNGWTEVVFDNAAITAALVLAGIVPTTTLDDLYIIFDEPGSVHLDNISVNKEVVGAPTSPSTKDDCKKGGYKNFYPAFANQGDCVSYFATKGKNKPKSITP